MASEYLKWKYRDVQPWERRELTPAEKRRNWWHYHKWHVVIGVVLLGIAVDLAVHALGIGQVKPDYQVAYVGTNALPNDTAAAIESAFSALGEDLNGDGRVVVKLVQYASANGADAGVLTSTEVALTADLMECESYFFLLEDPERFQISYHSLRRLDGSLPEDGDYSAEGTYLGWGQCPALAGTELGNYSYEVMGKTVTGSSDELAAGLHLARRGFWTEKTTLYPEECGRLWDRLTEGALS